MCPPPDDRPQDLREFYDPDTVDLMQWIQQNSEPDDAFSGSMQLLAGVKLCTGRTLTNHPHFEDKHLRDRTKELYQMYAKVCARPTSQAAIEINSARSALWLCTPT